MTNKRTIDHIVYAVPNLSLAMEQFEAKAGIRPTFGGYHLTKGTKNALVNLGNQCYLELLATDANNTAIAPPRWMGIDLIEKPQVTRWSLKSTDLPTDSHILKQTNPRLGEIQGGQRKTSKGRLLTWEMILPLSSPTVDILPFMTNWQQSETHPTDQLTPSCQLVEMRFFHPTPSLLQSIFNDLGLNYVIKEGPSPTIQIHLDTPNGKIIL